MSFKIVSREDWLTARVDLLTKEKKHTRAADALAAQRRSLPMVHITKPYTFTGPNGPATLYDLFASRKQLIIYHFMLGPDMPEGCEGCSFFADNLPSHLEHFNSRDTTLVLVSRAPLAKIDAFKSRMGWTYPWYSSFETSFNYDFHVTMDADVAPLEYNFRIKEEAQIQAPLKGEMPGLSVFLTSPEGEVYHTYSTYTRGLDILMGANQLLDTAKLGRKEWNNGAPGWKLHDQYGREEST